MICDEHPRFFRGGQNAKQIEISTTNENRVRAQIRRVDVKGAQLREDMLVNIIVRRHALPLKSGPRSNESKAHWLLTLKITYENGGFSRTASALASDHSFPGHFHQPIRRIENRELGDVARGAVRESCVHPQLHTVFRFNHDLFPRIYFDIVQLRRGGEIVTHSLDNPFAKNPVFQRTRFEAKSTFVRDASCRLKE